MKLRKSLAIWGVFLALAACNLGAPEPESVTQAIVGVGEDGKQRAFGLLPMKNKPLARFRQTSDPQVNYAIKLATKAYFYGLVECTEFNRSGPDVWLTVAERRAAAGDLHVLPNRTLWVSDNADSTFDGTLPCRLVGNYLLTAAEVDQILGEIVENPGSVSEAQYLVAQSFYLALRGSYEGEGSRLLDFYLDHLSAHLGITTKAAMRAAMREMDGDFNPCSNDDGVLGLSKTALGWKKRNYACVEIPGQGVKGYRPAGNLYVKIRNKLAAEMARIHLRVLSAATGLDADILDLVNLLSSTAAWDNFQQGSKWQPLAEYLAGKNDSFDFAGKFGSGGFGLAGVDMDDAEIAQTLYVREHDQDFSIAGNDAPAGFALLGAAGSSSSGSRQPRGNSRQGATKASEVLIPKDFYQAVTPNFAELLKDAQINVRTGDGKVATIGGTRLFESISKQKTFIGEKDVKRYNELTKTINDKNASESAKKAAKEELTKIVQQSRQTQAAVQASFQKALAERNKEAGKTDYAGVRAADAIEAKNWYEVNAAFQEMAKGKKSKVEVGGRTYEYVTTRDKGSYQHAVLRDQEGTYHFLHKNGDVSSWKKEADLKSVASEFASKSSLGGSGAKVDMYHREGTLQYQGVIQKGGKVDHVFGIKDGTGEIEAYKTVKLSDHTSAIDWKDDKNQEQVVKQLAATVKQQRQEYVNALNSVKELKESNVQLSQDQAAELFRAKANGVDFSKPEEVRKFVGEEKFDKMFQGEAGHKAVEAFNKTYGGYEKRLSKTVGDMLSEYDRSKLGINPATENIETALKDAAHSTKQDTHLGNADNISELQQLFDPTTEQKPQETKATAQETNPVEGQSPGPAATATTSTTASESPSQISPEDAYANAAFEKDPDAALQAGYGSGTFDREAFEKMASEDAKRAANDAAGDAAFAQNPDGALQAGYSSGSPFDFDTYNAVTGQQKQDSAETAGQQGSETRQDGANDTQNPATVPTQKFAPPGETILVNNTTTQEQNPFTQTFCLTDSCSVDAGGGLPGAQTPEQTVAAADQGATGFDSQSQTLERLGVDQGALGADQYAGTLPGNGGYPGAPNYMDPATLTPEQQQIDTQFASAGPYNFNQPQTGFFDSITTQGQFDQTAQTVQATQTQSFDYLGQYYGGDQLYYADYNQGSQGGYGTPYNTFDTNSVVTTDYNYGGGGTYDYGGGTYDMNYGTYDYGGGGGTYDYAGGGYGDMGGSTYADPGAGSDVVFALDAESPEGKPANPEAGKSEAGK